MKKQFLPVIILAGLVQIAGPAGAAIPVQDSANTIACSEFFAVYKPNIHVAIQMAGTAPGQKAAVIAHEARAFATGLKCNMKPFSEELFAASKAARNRRRTEVKTQHPDAQGRTITTTSATPHR
jgi:hypothetical protein